MAVAASQIYLSMLRKQEIFLKRITSATVLNHQRSWFTSQNCIQENKIKSIKSQNRMVDVEWRNNKISRYPFIFLRDNCQCSECFHPQTKSRQLNTFQEIDLHIEPSHVECVDDHVIIKWPNQHRSTFTSKWLEDRKFPNTLEDVRPTTLHGIRPIPWDASKMAGNIPTFKYNALLSCDNTLFDLLQNLIEHGLCLVKNAPLEAMTLPHIGKRMGSNILRKTHYGEIWDVKSKTKPNNLGYTTKMLSLHTDLPYYSYQPCVQLLHCIQQVEGEESDGCNMMTDGLHVIQHLQQHYPEYYQILTTVKVRFSDVGTDEYGKFIKQHERPIIGLDHFGGLDSVASSIEVRDSFINAPADDVIKLYEAYYKFRELLHEKQNMVSYKMHPGDILIFDNKRVLHGRTDFHGQNSPRWLQGIYVDWDEVRSTFRVLQQQLNQK